jgi:hypothetical protein
MKEEVKTKDHRKTYNEYRNSIFIGGTTTMSQESRIKARKKRKK